MSKMEKCRVLPEGHTSVWVTPQFEKNPVEIYKAFCLDVAQNHMNGAPDEIRTHSWRFVSLASEASENREIVGSWPLDIKKKGYQVKVGSFPCLPSAVVDFRSSSPVRIQGKSKRLRADAQVLSTIHVAIIRVCSTSANKLKKVSHAPS